MRTVRFVPRHVIVHFNLHLVRLHPWKRTVVGCDQLVEVHAQQPPASQTQRGFPKMQPALAVLVGCIETVVPAVELALGVNGTRFQRVIVIGFIVPQSAAIEPVLGVFRGQYHASVSSMEIPFVGKFVISNASVLPNLQSGDCRLNFVTEI